MHAPTGAESPTSPPRTPKFHLDVMPLGVVGSITSRAAERAKEEALKPFYNQIDSLLTSKAKAFFDAMGIRFLEPCSYLWSDSA